MILISLISLVCLLGIVLYFNKRPIQLILLTSFVFILQFEFSSYINFELIQRPIVFRLSDIFIVVIFILSIKEIFKNPKILYRLYAHYKLLVVFIIYVTLHSLFFMTYYGFATLAELRFKVYFILFILYTVLYIKSDIQAFKLLKYLSFLLISFILFAPIQWLLNQDIALLRRPINALSYFSVVLGVFIYYLEHKNVYKKIPVKYYFIIFTFIIVSYFAHHRSVWAAILAMLIFLLLINEINRFRFAILLLYGGLLLFLFFSPQVEFLIQRGRGIMNPAEDPSGSWRLMVWKAIYTDIIVNGQYWGVGLGNRFKVYVPEFRMSLSQGSHSGYLAFLYYTGIPGALLFSAFLTSLLKKMVSKFFIAQKDKNKFIFLLASVTLVGTMTYMINYDSDYVSWFIIASAMSLTIWQSVRQSSTKRYEKRHHYTPH